MRRRTDELTHSRNQRGFSPSGSDELTEPPTSPSVGDGQKDEQYRESVSTSVRQLLDLSTRLALRPKEAAEAMGIGERTLRQMLPELPHVRVGTTVLLPVEGLREWLKEHAESERSHVDQAVDEILDSVSKG